MNICFKISVLKYKFIPIKLHVHFSKKKKKNDHYSQSIISFPSSRFILSTPHEIKDNFLRIVLVGDEQTTNLDL